MIAIALPKWKLDLVTYIMLSSSYYPCNTYSPGRHDRLICA
jgi:hypothetical protein